MIDKSHAERIWDKLANGVFRAARLRPVIVNGICFFVLCAGRKRDWSPDLYVDSGLSFYLWPRLSAYRYRWVLVPRENLSWQGRWELRSHDVHDWIAWAAHMGYVVTFSTFLSGASEPFLAHAQTFPLKQGNTFLTALKRIKVTPVVRRGTMSHFEAVEVATLHRYPMKGLRFAGDGTATGREQVARKVFEIALTYHGLKAVNIVVVPNARKEPAVFLFPRRKRASVVVGKTRWQIAALEVNGLLQARTVAQSRQLNASRISHIFESVSLTDSEFRDFLTLLDSF